jgi:hypothetical protein
MSIEDDIAKEIAKARRAPFSHHTAAAMIEGEVGAAMLSEAKKMKKPDFGGTIPTEYVRSEEYAKAKKLILAALRIRPMQSKDLADATGLKAGVLRSFTGQMRKDGLIEGHPVVRTNDNVMWKLAGVK